MNNPVVYEQANDMQRQEVRRVLQKYKNKLAWQKGGKDSIFLLDIGCGSGDSTIDFVLPMLPPSFERLMGIDKSRKMASHAHQKYSNQKISFEQFDFVVDRIDRLPKFNHITSFYCFNWIPNQKLAVQNVYDLLKPGGDFLLLFVVDNPTFWAWKQLARNPKWSKYLEDVDIFVPPFLTSKSPDSDFKNILKTIGFSKYRLEREESFFDFNSIEELRMFLIGVCPVHDRIPEDEREQYYDDTVETVLYHFKTHKHYRSYDANRVRMSYINIVAYGKK